MIDIKNIRNNEDFVRKNLTKRNDKSLLEEFEKLISYDKLTLLRRREVDILRNNVNTLARDIAKEISETNEKSKIESMMDERKSLDVELNKIEGKFRTAELLRNEILLKMPNLLQDEVPIGSSDKDNVEIRRFGIPNKKNVRSHGELIEELELADFEAARKSTGAGFVFLKGNLARLDIALQMFALENLHSKGYIPIQVPLMMNVESYEGVTDIKDFSSVMFRVSDDSNDVDKRLIATSEHPIVAMMQDKVIEPDKLPLKFVGVSPCFRKEIGSSGVDTRGLFRMHQFNKVEQVAFTTPESSNTMLEELIGNAEILFKELEIPYRTVAVCTGDIGTVASKKYDIEAWSPRQNNWIEVVSGSNCTDYQSRRLNIKYGKRGGKTQLVHTLNCTAIATSRAMVAIIENNQENDKVIIPKVLRKYMGGIEFL